MNVTVIASNAYETVSQVVSFEMVGKVKGPLIDDFQIISNKAQEKEFEISFETIGSGSCMVIDFKDGSMKVCWKLGLLGKRFFNISFFCTRALEMQLTAQSGNLMSSISQFWTHSPIFKRFITPTSEYCTTLKPFYMPFCQQLWYFQCFRPGQEQGDRSCCV